MARLAAVLLVASLHACVDARALARDAATPVSKVIQLLKKVAANVAADGQQEAAQYDKFACFCKEQLNEKAHQIESSEKKIERLGAKIDMLAAAIDEHGGQLKEAQQSIEQFEGEVKTAATKLGEESEAYEKTQEEMTSAVTAIQGAIAALKESKGNLEGNAKLNLARLVSATLSAMPSLPHVQVSESQLSVLAELAHMGVPGDAHGYTYHSNEILDVLEKLLATSKEARQEHHVASSERQTALERKISETRRLLSILEEDKTEYERALAEKSEEKTIADEEKRQEVQARQADEVFLKELTDSCQEKAAVFDQRSQSRAAELAALAEATEALEKDVLPNYAANRKLVEPAEAAPQPPAAAFLQVRREARGSAARQEMSDDHFVKVRSLIKDLISRLEKSAAEEASTKSLCDESIGDSVSVRDSRSAHIESLAADIAAAKARGASATKEIAEKGSAIAALKKGLAEATQLNAEEMAQSKKTLEMANAGLGATKAALQVLQEYYEGAEALVQTGYTPPNADREGNTVADLAPDVADSQYTGKQDASKGIIGMIEVIISDFERTIDATENKRSAAEAAFKKYSLEVDTNVEAMDARIAALEDEKAAAEESLVKLTEEMGDTKGELDDALKSLEASKPMCVDSESFADRAKSRKEEVEGLKRAHDILESWHA